MDLGGRKVKKTQSQGLTVKALTIKLMQMHECENGRKTIHFDCPEES